MKNTKWRFENGKIYKFSSAHAAYVYFATYLQAGIKSGEATAFKIKKAEDLEMWRFERDLDDRNLKSLIRATKTY